MGKENFIQELLKLTFHKYCIAYIDILGAKKYINDNPENFLNDLKAIHEEALLNARMSETISQRKFFVKIFSDNILVGAQIVGNNSYQKDKIEEIIRIAGNVYNKTLQLGYLARGAITIGDLCENQTFVYGKALVEAVEMEEKLAIYPRIIAKKEIRDFLPSFFINERDYFYTLNTFPFFGLYKSENYKTILLDMLSKHKDDCKIKQKIIWTINRFNENYIKTNSKSKTLHLITENEINERLI